MKNAIISFIIFIIMITTMFISVKYLNKTCEQMEANSNTLEDLINAEQWEEADELSNKTLSQWKKYALIIPIFANHSELDTLNVEMLKLTQYTKCQSKDEALASTHVIKFFLNNVKELQKVNLQNIL
jgi:hypothetical protein